MSKKTIAIAGATGAVGIEAIKVLERSSLTEYDLRLFASARSKGRMTPFKDKQIQVEELTTDSFKGIDYAIFSIGADLSKEFAPHAVNSGCIVVDNSSAFRMDKDTPLIIPEINAQEISNHKGIIANPNCTTIVMLMAIYPIYRLSKIESIIMSSYQAVSGAGLKAMAELEGQLKAHLEGKGVVPTEFKHPIAMNVFSHDSPILDNGFNKEEQKAIDETRKILDDEAIRVSPTCIRVPVMRSHSVSVRLITKERLGLDQIRVAIRESKGVSLVDHPEDNHFPMPIEASHRDDVLIGRIRRGMSHENEIMLFACGDQLLKGAALNAVQIVERLI
jgi:aspartate-semialdehyde dehydrogenase